MSEIQETEWKKILRENTQEESLPESFNGLEADDLFPDDQPIYSIPDQQYYNSVYSKHGIDPTKNRMPTLKNAFENLVADIIVANIRSYTFLQDKKLEEIKLKNKGNPETLMVSFYGITHAFNKNKIYRPKDSDFYNLNKINVATMCAIVSDINKIFDAKNLGFFRKEFKEVKEGGEVEIDVEGFIKSRSQTISTAFNVISEIYHNLAQKNNAELREDNPFLVKEFSDIAKVFFGNMEKLISKTHKDKYGNKTDKMIVDTLMPNDAVSFIHSTYKFGVKLLNDKELLSKAAGIILKDEESGLQELTLCGWCFTKFEKDVNVPYDLKKGVVGKIREKVIASDKEHGFFLSVQELTKILWIELNGLGKDKYHESKEGKAYFSIIDKNIPNNINQIYPQNLSNLTRLSVLKKFSFSEKSLEAIEKEVTKKIGSFKLVDIYNVLDLFKQDKDKFKVSKAFLEAVDNHIVLNSQKFLQDSSLEKGKVDKLKTILYDKSFIGDYKKSTDLIQFLNVKESHIVIKYKANEDNKKRNQR